MVNVCLEFCTRCVDDEGRMLFLVHAQYNKCCALSDTIIPVMGRARFETR